MLGQSFTIASLRALMIVSLWLSLEWRQPTELVERGIPRRLEFTMCSPASIHCAALRPDYFCTKINPYTSYQQAINGTIQQLNARLYSGLNSVADIYNLYETGNVKTAAPALDLLQNTIYKNQLHGDPSDIRQSRCP